MSSDQTAQAGGTFVVIGAKGRTGKEIVRTLLELDAAAGVKKVLACVRDPAKVPAGTFPENDERLEVVRCDLSEPETLPFEGDDAKSIHTVFYAASGWGYEMAKIVDRYGPGIVGKAAVEAGLNARIILISSQYVDPVNRFSFIRGLLNTLATGLFHFQGIMDFKAQGEQLLRESGVKSWTILRPGRLVEGELKSSGLVKTGQTNGAFMPGSALARSDLAEICVTSAFTEAASNVTVEIGTDQKKSAEPLDGEALFGSLQKDPIPSSRSSQYWERIQ